MDKNDKSSVFRINYQQKFGIVENDLVNLQDAFSETIVENQAPRYIDKAGREHIEVPAVILGMQVILGTGGYEYGAELVSEEALWSSLNQWNDKPVVIYHTEGSARELENLVEQKVGFVHSAEIIGAEYADGEERNPRIKVMLRLDVDLLKGKGDDGQLVIDTFDTGRIMEVSTGYYLNDWVYQESTFRGRDYSVMQTKIMPDHLALLPNAVGAYSIQDGGGANRNNKGEPMKDNEIKALEELVVNIMDEKLKVFPTKDEFSEMVGNAVNEKFEELKDSLTALEGKVSPLVDNEQNAEVVADETRVNLIAKVKEKNVSFTDEVLNATPNEVLESFLVENETTSLGRVEENTEEVTIMPLNTALNKNKKEAE